MGAQARQAPRVEPAAARRDRHDLHVDGRAACASRRPTSATSSRSTPTRGCRGKPPAGWSARWRIRSTTRASTPTPARRRGLCGAAAARHAVAADRPRGLAVPAHLLQHERHRPLRLRRVRRVPGSLRRRLLYRQGHLRRRCLRGRARRPRTGKHAAQSRSFRGDIRPRRPRFRHRGRRGVSLTLRRRRRCASTAGRAATGNCCPGFSVAARVAGEDRKHERASRRSAAGRCSTICDGRCRRRQRPRLAGGMDPVLPCRGGLDLLHPVDDRLPTLLPVLAAIVPRRPGSRLAATWRPRRGSSARSLPDRAAGQLPRPSGMVDDRCDRHGRCFVCS